MIVKQTFILKQLNSLQIQQPKNNFFPICTMYIHVKCLLPLYFSCCVAFNNFHLYYKFQVLSRRIRNSPLKSPIKKSPVKQHKWSFEEERAFVEFIGMVRMDPKYGGCRSNGWPALRSNHMFWTDAAHHIQTIGCSSVLF